MNQRVNYNPQTTVTPTAPSASSGATVTNVITETAPCDPAEVKILSEMVSAMVDKKGIEYFWKFQDGKRVPYSERINDLIWVSKVVVKQLKENKDGV